MLKIFTRSVINCRQSLSPDTRKHSPPRSSTSRATVAKTSSASKPGDAEHRNFHRFEHAADRADLRPQVRRHFGPMRLVLVEQLVAERRPGQIERAEQIVGLLLFQQIQHVAREAQARRRPARRAGRSSPEGVKHLKDERKRIDDVDACSSPCQTLRQADRRIVAASAAGGGHDGTNSTFGCRPDSADRFGDRGRRPGGFALPRQAGSLCFCGHSKLRLRQ